MNTFSGTTPKDIYPKEPKVEASSVKGSFPEMPETVSIEIYFIQELEKRIAKLEKIVSEIPHIEQ